MHILVNAVCFTLKYLYKTSVLSWIYYVYEYIVFQVKAQWTFMALVVDRILLWLYIGIVGFSTVFILMNAPALYDTSDPMVSGVRLKEVAPQDT